MKTKSIVSIVVVFAIVFLLVASLFAEVDVTSKVSIMSNGFAFDKGAGITSLYYQLRSSFKQTLTGPFHVVIEGTDNPDVSLINPDGYTHDGKPYLIYDLDQLKSGENSPDKTWFFDQQCGKRVSASFRKYSTFNRVTLKKNCSTSVTIYFSVLSKDQGLNHLPVANAGPDQTVGVGQKVYLDGSRSTDVDGNSLSYRWSFPKLSAKTAPALSDPRSVRPFFTVPRPGSYLVQLVVSDGMRESEPSTCTVSTGNIRPVARAGADQTVEVGGTVHLDGSGSTDVYGNLMSYRWALVSVPRGSQAKLSDPTLMRPSFKVDRPGDYVAQLIVSNKLGNSYPDLCVISTDNSRPIAYPGLDQAVGVGETAILDGSKSTDVDGDPLSYRWSLISVPAGSAVALSDLHSVRPSFAVDLPGIYVGQLIVNDGMVDSLPKTSVVSTGNASPVADAGPDQKIVVGQKVLLDGSGSWDGDGDPLNFWWSLISKPSKSNSALSDPTATEPSFVVDLPGIYVAQLIVDDGKVESIPGTVILTTENTRPVADAGAEQMKDTGDVVQLDGSGSWDADGNALTYRWAMLSRPKGSSAFLNSPETVNPTFVTDLEGFYVVQLLVNDGKTDSYPETVVVQAVVRMVVVPSLVGLTQIVAESALAGAKLKAGVISTAYDPKVPAGKVISQSPLAGVSVQQGTTVNLLISLGPANVSVPNVVGMTQADASSTLTTAGLNVGTSTQANHATIPSGSVISQDPPAGAFVPPGTPVNFVISMGPASVTVPDVVGLTHADATSVILAANLTTGGITTANSNTVPAGKVISQNPLPGATVPPGTAVSLLISLGPSGLPPDPATVAPPVNPGVATTVFDSTSFLYTGPNPIQTGVAPGTIELKRAAVLRGRVLDKSNVPLSGVTISILNHPEFGQTLSRADGMFDMAVNGGGYLTVNYQKAGYLPAQRQVSAPWQDYAGLPDVALIPLDAKVTTVDLNAGVIQVAQGTSQTDTDGTRQATLLFPAGSTAQLVMPDGSTQPLTTLNVRATEYTVGPNGPKAMPGELPPSSGYTYAAELSADEAFAVGATSVRFSQPVPFYVQNFVGFPVGSLVPTGFYDRVKGQWVASDNGRVIKVLGVTGGLADLDLDGSGTVADAATLATLGITNAERQHLATLYTPGQSLWRVLIPHFSPIDCNWPYGPRPNSQPPGSGNPKPGPKPNKPPDDPCKKGGSIIECQPQTLGEVINVTGTPFQLHYNSNRVPGRQDKNVLPIRLSGATLPPDLQRVHLEIAIAGRTFKKNFAPQPNLFDTFTWDGKDAYGRSAQGQQPVTVRIGYEYMAQYYATPDSWAASYNRFGSLPITIARGGGGGSSGVIFSTLPVRTATPPIILWQDYKASLGAVDILGLGGWSLSVHHTYDVAGQILYLGNGNQRSAAALGVVIATAAGTGVKGFAGDGGPATQAMLRDPAGIAVGPDGSLYIADRYNHRIRRVGPDGIITTVAGTTVAGFSGDGGPATQARLNSPTGIATGSDGSLYISDSGNNRIRRVGPDGIITTVVGTAVYGFSGDGGPAIQAQIWEPRGRVAVGPDGSLYIPDLGNNRIRRVGPDGIITTVAGTGFCGFLGDGGPATKAQLCMPSGVAVGRDGTLYIADTGDSAIRRVGPDGIFTTMAYLKSPEIALASDGSLYMAVSSLIQRLGPDGVITTVAGTGVYGFSGDGGLAIQAQLASPQGIAVGPDGTIYVSDTYNERIRKLGPPIPGFSASDILIAAEDGGEVYVFTGDGRHLRTHDALTGAVLFQFSYDSVGLLTAIADRDGNMTTIQRDSSGNPTAIVAPGSQRTTLTVNTDGYLASVTNPAGEAAHLTYNSGAAEGLLATLTDPRGNVHRFTYDAVGRLIRDEDPAGGVTTLARTDIVDGHYTVSLTTALGLVTTYEVEELDTGNIRRARIDPSGARTEVLISTNGSQTGTYPDGTKITTEQGPDPRWGIQAPILTSLSVTLPGGSPVTRSVKRSVTLSDPKNLFSLVSQTDTINVNGQTYTSVFEAATSKFTLTTPGGRKSVMTADNRGHLTSYQPAGAAMVTWEWDNLGRLKGLSQAGETWAYGYHDLLNPYRVSSRTDALGLATQFAYDNANRIIRTTTPGGEQLLFSYDGNGNRTHVLLPGGADHLLGYLSTDQQYSYTPPGNAAAYTRSFDLDGRVTGVTLPSGTTQTWSYDPAGRPLGVSTASATTTISYGVGDLTRRPALIRRTPAGGTSQDLAFTYQGELVKGLSFSGPTGGNYTYSYDANFRLTGMNLSSGADTSSSTFAYDADGLAVKLGPFTVTRDPASGLPTRMTHGTGQHDLTFDTKRRLKTRAWQVNGTQVYQEQLTYDVGGRITRRVETVGGGTATYDYSYDSDSRLIAVAKDSTTVEEYAYDTRGNRTSRRLNGGAVEMATYDLQDRLQGRGGLPYTFDVNGFLSQRGTDIFQFGGRGELLSATVSGQAVSYGYDGYGRLTSRTDASGTAQYLYGNPAHHMQLTASHDTVGVLTTYSYDEGGRLLAIQRGGTQYYVATNLLGTPMAVVDSTGAILKQLEWDTFGNLVSDSNPDFALAVGFAGGVLDQLTGLTRFGMRDYEAASGRWISRDAALFSPGQTNLYAYVDNDPVDKFDPVGLYSLGGSAYDGIGGGVKVAWTDQGWSFCAELGFGFGDSFEFNPSGALDKNGVSLDAEVSVKAGPLGGITSGVSIKECAHIEQKGKVCIGPLCTEIPYNAAPGDTPFSALQWQDRSAKAESSPGDFEKAAKGFKGLGISGEGKLVANFCAAGKW